MTSGTFNTKSHVPHPAGHVYADVFRGHAFSFLVAASVLLGSMFAAHSAIVELASIDVGYRLLTVVQEVRVEIAHIPGKASTHMASVVSAHGSLENTLVHNELSPYFSFSSGMEGLFAPYISLVSPEPQVAAQRPLLAEFEPLKGQSAVSGVIAAGQINFGVLKHASIALSVAADPYISVSEAMLQEISAIEHRMMAAYVRGVYAWVDSTHSIARTVVHAAYTFGDLTIATAVEGPPDIQIHSIPAFALWVATTHELARMVVEPQLVAGAEILTIANDVRAHSERIQMIIGGDIARTAMDVAWVASDLLGDVPATATASVADFLTLQERP